MCHWYVAFLCTRRGLAHLFQAFGFALECHLPYYALRQTKDAAEDGRKLRARIRFMPPGSQGKAMKALYLHQAMISVIVFGVDEWVWTSICFVETYFRTEESIDRYFAGVHDAPSSAGTPADRPIWNPREYYLMVLSRRIHQVTLEWYNVLAGFDENVVFQVFSKSVPRKLRIENI
jgi:hypothetical protein